MKSLLLCAFSPEWGCYCWFAIWGQGAPKKTLRLASLPRGRRRRSVSAKQDVYLKLHLKPAAPHSTQFHICLCTASQTTKDKPIRGTIRASCICVHVGSCGEASVVQLQICPDISKPPQDSSNFVFSALVLTSFTFSCWIII